MNNNHKLQQHEKTQLNFWKGSIMVKTVVLGLSLGVMTSMGAIQASAKTFETNFTARSSQSVILENKLTKAQCLKKDGYIWDSSSKKCVKDTRGSE